MAEYVFRSKEDCNVRMKIKQLQDNKILGSNSQDNWGFYNNLFVSENKKRNEIVD